MRADLSQIFVFARVAECGSFSAAARLLGMPKSTVSRKVSELEERLGARLVQRTTRKLSLTDAGRTYHRHAARIMAELEDADAAVSQMQSEPRGLLRVTAPLSFSMLGPMITDYMAQHPRVQVHLVCTDRVVDLVEEGFDLAIRAGRLADSSLIARPLGKLRWVVVAAPDYCARHGVPRTPAELERHVCIAFGSGPTPNVWTLHAGEKTASVRVTPCLTVNEVDIMRDAARGGIGVAMLPDYACAAELRSGALRRVLPNWSSTEVPVNAVYPTARHLSPKVASFIALLGARLPTMTGSAAGTLRRGAAK